MTRYVVSRPFADSNIGSNLSSLAGALWLARRLGRSLVIDWRGLSQLKDPRLNYFTEFFETPPALGGVPLLYAPTELCYETGEDARMLEPGEARATGLGAPAPEKFLILQTYHGLDRVHPGTEVERFALLRSLYRRLRPSASIAAAVEAWAGSELDAPFVVGVNVRTGNGMYFQPGMRYASRVDISLFDDAPRFLRLLERACRDRMRLLPSTLRSEFRIFYATDSAAMSELLARLPNAVTRRSSFPPPNTGDLLAPDDDRSAIEDTIADMFLLARCDALVYNTSLFNQYARVVTGQFGGNLVHFESLVRRKRALARTRSVRRLLEWTRRA